MNQTSHHLAADAAMSYSVCVHSLVNLVLDRELLLLDKHLQAYVYAFLFVLLGRAQQYRVFWSRWNRLGHG